MEEEEKKGHEPFFFVADMKYDYAIIGAGLYGSVLARELADRGKKVLVIDRRNHVAGNAYTEKVNGIQVHVYGAHIFHTNDSKVWEYMNRFSFWNRFTNSPIANYRGEIYSLPFSMYTFNKMWGVITPDEAKKIIHEQQGEIKGEPRNLEEQAIRLVGRDIYKELVEGYTEKQWGRKCTELPPEIIKRLPVRFTYDNNYFNALYQGIPIYGYTYLVENILDSPNVEIKLTEDFKDSKQYILSNSGVTVFSGALDEFYGHCYGPLEYRSVRFETETLETDNYQGNAVVNYTDPDTPWTRIIEHKWFNFGKDENGHEIDHTVISREFSTEWKVGEEPYYPICDQKNNALLARYRELADKEENVFFGGRLGEYKYYDMDQVVAKALADSEKLLS